MKANPRLFPAERHGSIEPLLTTITCLALRTRRGACADFGWGRVLGSRHGVSQPWAKAVPVHRALPGLQHSRGRPCLEGEGILEPNHGCAQFELGVGNKGTEVHLGLTAALLHHSVSRFWDCLEHLGTEEGRITEQSPESQAEKGLFWPPRSAS